MNSNYPPDFASEGKKLGLTIPSPCGSEGKNRTNSPLPSGVRTKQLELTLPSPFLGERGRG